MRFVKKEELLFKEGYLTIDGKIIAINNEVINQLNDLERVADVVNFVEDNKDKIDAAMNPVEMPKFKPSEYKSCKVKHNYETPKLDAYVQNIEDIIKEIENKDEAENAANILNEHYSELIDWISSDEVIILDDPVHVPTKMYTNILNITVEMVTAVIADYVDNHDAVQAVCA